MSVDESLPRLNPFILQSIVSPFPFSDLGALGVLGDFNPIFHVITRFQISAAA
jgi:hypothetical protein